MTPREHADILEAELSSPQPPRDSVWKPALAALLADSERFHTHVETMIEPELLERAKRLHEACEQTARTYPYEGRFCAAALEET